MAVTLALLKFYESLVFEETIRSSVQIRPGALSIQLDDCNVEFEITGDEFMEMDWKLPNSFYYELGAFELGYSNKEVALSYLFSKY